MHMEIPTQHEQPGRPLIEVDDVWKAFGATKALNGVNLQVQAGRTHALVGRNGAGKSTLVSTMTGLVVPDKGQILFDGEPAPSVRTPKKWQEKVACVYQHRRLVPQLSVAENLLLNNFPVHGSRITWKDVYSQADAMLGAWGIDVDPRKEASSLSVEDAQLVEIVRALSGGSRFVILDEPTAQLVSSGIRRLFKELLRLQEAGVTFLYISHHLDEIEELCQDVTVLRNGRVVATAPVEDMPQDKIVAAMVGDAQYASVDRRRENSVLAHHGGVPAIHLDKVKVEELEEPVTLSVAPGEVLGIAGHAGSGSRHLAASLVGLVPLVSGRVLLGGKPANVSTPARAIAAGIGYVPEDRHREGYVPMLSIEDNIATSVLPRLGRWGFVKPQERRRLASNLSQELDVACSSTDQAVGSLSGGNQQKVVLARAMASRPEVLILVHPTAGVDVASKDTLFDAIERERQRGVAVIIVSDEVDELRGCDRVLAFMRGRHVKSFGSTWEAREIVAAMEGVEEHV
ncbi:sugar ABC transporter ATP-binding protein [Pseudarthrobacter enclensis]|nr:sugar ABC transporter ATP-binding protein [Pseudarthrobacter enclensis]